MTDSKPWTRNYPSGVAAEIDIHRYSSLVHVIDEACAKFGPMPAFENMGVGLTYRRLDELSQAFGAYLQNDLGLVKGDRVAIQMPNVLQYPVALFGALRAGLVVVNTNPLYTPREMEHQFRDSGAKAIVILANFASKLEEVMAGGRTELRHVIVSEIGDLFPAPKRVVTNLVVKHVKKMVPAFRLAHTPFREALRRGEASTFRKTEVGHEDLAFLQYTGGTTGVSKGAMLTHRNIVANLLQMSEWMKPLLQRPSRDPSRQDACLAPLPLYHVFCLTVNCMGFFKEGVKNILVTNPRDIPALVKEIEKTDPTAITVVNTLASALTLNPGFQAMMARHPPGSRRLFATVAGGMALQTAVAERWKQLTGTPVVEGYGLTEASPIVTCNPLSDSLRLGTIGLPVPSTEVRIQKDDGKGGWVPAGPGEEGELCVRGAQVMKGYWNQAGETGNVFTPDGWLKTGDIARQEEGGFFRIVDRMKDMILVSGFNVYPNEVEEIVAQHPGVAEVAVIGVPDAHSGEVVKAFVVRRDKADASTTPESIIALCRKQLTSYKVPKQVEFRDELPKNNVGKILRRMLR